MLSDLGVECSIETAALFIPASSLVALNERVGFRYNCEKSVRLSLLATAVRHQTLNPSSSPSKFLASIGVNLSSFSSRFMPHSRSSLPTFHLRVCSIEPVGDRTVYDISVPDFYSEGESNFVANGMIVHNCRFPFHPICGWKTGLRIEMEAVEVGDTFDVLKVFFCERHRKHQFNKKKLNHQLTVSESDKEEAEVNSDEDRKKEEEKEIQEAWIESRVERRSVGGRWRQRK